MKVFIALTLIVVFAFSSCKKYRFDDEVNFNAAYVVNGADNSISVIDLSNNEIKSTRKLYKAEWPHHISLNPDKSVFAVAAPGTDLSGGHAGHGSDEPKGRIIIVDAKTGKKEERITLNKMNHNAIFSPDGSELWTSQMEEEGKVRVYDTKDYKLKFSISVGNMPAEVTFSQDGVYAFVANGGSDNVTAIRVSDKTVSATINVGDNPVGAWRGSDNKMYVDNEHGKSISVIDVSSLQVEETISLGFTPAMAAYNSSLNELWVTDTENGKAVYFQRVANQWVYAGEIPTGSGAHAIVFSNDNLKAYVTNQVSGTVSVIDVNSKSIITDITVGSKPNGIVLRYL